MKSVLLVRHAKSSWKDTSLQDFERPLSNRGKEDAREAGKILQERELLPQLIVSSSAVRAKSTVEEITHSSNYTQDIIYLDTFYLAEPIIYVESLRLLDDHMERVMLVGHNPGMEIMLQILSGKVMALPTGAIACLSIPVNHWSELSLDSECELTEFWVPREILKEELRQAEKAEKARQKEEKERAKEEKNRLKEEKK